MNILIIEDSQTLRETLHDGFVKLGYGVDAIGDGMDGLDYARFKEYDVIVLDLMLPGMDGLSILRELRNARKQTHVLILSAKDQTADRIRGLQLGADDYMVKPFSFEELCARIGALVRRRYEAKNPVIEIGQVTINMAMRDVRLGQTQISLTPSEYAILEYLALNRGRVVSVEKLIEKSRGSDAIPNDNLIQVMICNLRKKLMTSDSDEIIKTRRGYGYYIP